ncbi:MAG: hypothetical protein LAO78_06240 [Acidobacteriia bacterium]|nr:hypothetical protein [Terriglobia bacterium]
MKVREIAVILALTLLVVNAGAQQRASNSPAGDRSNELPRFELGIAFSGVHLSENNNFGVGARAVVNLTSFFSLEGEGNLFLNDATPGILSRGRAVEGLFGPKIGFRTDTVGIFGKVRPGVISFSNTVQGITFNPTVPSAFTIETGRLTEPALDLGTVIEFYPARHWAWRTDLGNTMIFYRSSSFLGVTLPGTTHSNFQFSTGIQYRF